MKNLGMPDKAREPRVAIVHDALVNSGGAERTAAFMAMVFPDADIITSAYLPDRTFAEFRQRRIATLPGARFATSERRTKQLLPLWLWGFRRLELGSYDFVLSSTTFAAKHVRPPASTPHTCYCYAPFRWLWKPTAYSPQSLPFKRLPGLLAPLVRPGLRQLDYAAMQRVTRIATSCENMAREIDACYQRPAAIIYPPIRLADYAVGAEPGDYFLTVSRLISHKRVDLAIRACETLKLKLIVVGDGPELAALQAIAGPNTHFAGRVSDAELRRLYRDCRALIFPSLEDYGLAPIEAQASGRPVIAYGAGGALETVTPGLSGILFPAQTVENVIAALEAYSVATFEPQVIRQSVQRFDLEIFRRNLRSLVLAGSPGGVYE